MNDLTDYKEPYQSPTQLSQKKRLFVESYIGDEIEAMRMAGFQGPDAYLKRKGQELLRDPDIQAAIKIRSQYLASTHRAVATRTERQALWTAVMRNEDPNRKPEVDANGVTIPEGNIPLGIRLKASELLGKSETDFVEKVDVNVNMTITDVIQRAYKVENTDLDAIEAQYREIQESKKLAKAQQVIQDAEVVEPKKLNVSDFI